MTNVTILDQHLTLAFGITNVKAYLAVPHPDIFWYHLNGMGTKENAPKKVLVTLFPYLFHVKTKWNIVYKHLKTEIFSIDTNILPQMHWTWNVFGLLATIIGGFGVWLNYLILNFKKLVCPKNVWMRYCLGLQRSHDLNPVYVGIWLAFVECPQDTAVKIHCKAFRTGKTQTHITQRLK